MHGAIRNPINTDPVVHACFEAQVGIDKEVVETNRNINLLQVDLKELLDHPCRHAVVLTS